MHWSFYLPIAGHSLNVFMLLGLGAMVGFLSGLTGVGGGFLMTPLLIMAGIPPTIAAASDSNQIEASSRPPRSRVRSRMIAADGMLVPQAALASVLAMTMAAWSTVCAGKSS